MGKDGISRNIVVVLGMHRSGTSAITRGLEALGVNLGDRLLPAHAETNEKGFFEDAEIYNINLELLAALDTDWDIAPPVLPLDFTAENVVKQKKRAIDVLNWKLENLGTFGFKDPRVARLLPFWQEIFECVDATVHYLIVTRHPMSVAKSLNSRDGFSGDRCHALWLDYVTASILHTENQPRIIVDYDIFLEDPASQLSRIAKALSLSFDPESAATQEYIRGFLEQRLRHSKFEFHDLISAPDVSNEMVAIYDLMLQMALDKTTVSARHIRETFLAVRGRLLGQVPAFRTSHYFARLDECITCQNRKLASLSHSVDELSRENEFLRRSMKSIEEWQKSWFNRAFHRWHPPIDAEPQHSRPNLFRRMAQSLMKSLPGGISEPNGSPGLQKTAQSASTPAWQPDLEDFSALAKKQLK